MAPDRRVTDQGFAPLANKCARARRLRDTPLPAKGSSPRLECFEADPANLRRRALFNDVAVLDRIMPQFTPGVFRCIYRTRCPPLQSPSVIGMRVGERDRTGSEAFPFSQRIKPAIDHHVYRRVETSSDVCIGCRRVRASISRRVLMNVSFIKDISPDS